MLNEFFSPRKFQFENIAGFVKEQNYPLTLETYRKITQQIFRRSDSDPRIAVVLKKSVDAFDTNFISSDVDEIRMTSNDYMSYAHQIMLKKAIIILPSFQDMRKKDIKLFRLVARSWIQRTIGILTKHELDPKPMTIIFKESHDGDFVAKQIACPDLMI